MKIKSINCLFIFLILFCSRSTSDFSASGFVFDKMTNLPVSDVKITLTCNGKNASTATDEKGSFYISISILPDTSNSAVLIFNKSGYKFYSQIIHYLFVGGTVHDTFYLEKG